MEEGYYVEMVEGCLRAHPREACGLLAGEIVEQGSGRVGMVRRVYPVRNVRDSSEEYFMEPEEQFRVFRAIREEGWELLSIFHSHPHTPPLPSRKDLAMAYYPGALYTIISLGGANPETRVYRIREGRHFECGLKVVGERSC